MAEVIEKEVDVNPQDDVANDVRAAYASLRGESIDQAPAETADTSTGAEEVEAESASDQARPATEGDGRARDAQGKFVAKDNSQSAPEKVVAPEQVSPPAEAAKPSIEQPSTAVVAAPVSWAADVKAVWPSLPPAVQQAVLKREAEVSQGFRQYSEQTKYLERAISPIAQEAKARGLSVEDGIQRLLDGQRFLEAQPAQAIMWLAQRHGLDLSELAQNPPAVQTQARPDPQFAQVSQTVQSLQERLDSILMDQNMSVVEQFASKPEHAFYKDVEDQLPDLMRALSATNPALKGAALLQEAYDLAVWRNPAVRSKMLEQQQAGAKQQATQQVQAKAAQATRAAVSVKGTSVASIAPKRQEEAAGDDPRDSVRAAINQLKAG